MAKIESVRDLDVYKMAFEAAMRIFHLTKTGAYRTWGSAINQPQISRIDTKKR